MNAAQGSKRKNIPKTVVTREVTLKGTSISPGIGIGISCLEESPSYIPKHRIDQSSIKAEQNRLYNTLKIARRQLRFHIKATHNILDEDLTRILKFHEIMLNDQDFLGNVERRIADERKNIGWAVIEKVDQLVRRFEAMRDPYLQARAEDIRDLGHIILETLSKEKKTPNSTLPRGSLK